MIDPITVLECKKIDISEICGLDDTDASENEFRQSLRKELLQNAQVRILLAAET